MRVARAQLFATIASVGLSAAAANAATHRVPSEYPTIQAAVDASGVGDTVTVAAGTYTNWQRRTIAGVPVDACVFLKTGIVLCSESGPDVTTIQLFGAYPYPRGIYGYDLGPEPNVVEGFTFVGVLPHTTAEAVAVWGPDGNVGDLSFRRCVFRDLSGGDDRVGGLYVSGLDAHVVECRFERCWGYVGGVLSYADNFDMSVCVFVDCVGTACRVEGEDSPNSFRALIEDTQFIGTRNYFQSTPGGLAVQRMGGACVVRRCRFEDNQSIGGGGGARVSGGPGTGLEECVFWNNRSTQSWGGALITGAAHVRGCTFVGNSAAPSPGFTVVQLHGTPATFSNNIIANSHSVGAAIGVSKGVNVVAGCNVFWNNAGGHADNYPFAATDRIADPLFCDATKGDFGLMAGSPCLPPSSIGCGLIGALGEGSCGVVSVEPSSWAKIKAAYRVDSWTTR